jgi:hypothetical protein
MKGASFQAAGLGIEPESSIDAEEEWMRVRTSHLDHFAIPEARKLDSQVPDRVFGNRAHP